MKHLITQPVSLDIATITQDLARSGTLQQAPSGLIYLDIDDNYIHAIFPHILHKSLEKVDYFSKPNAIGAHISIFYPEEAIKVHLCLDSKDLQTHAFDVHEVVYAKLNDKEYYALTATSPTLAELRHRHGLPKQPSFKNHVVPFHITIATTTS
jgi:hypothetical protein